LNPKKLIEVGFSPLHKRMTMSRTIKLYKLPAEPATPGFRQMVPADADAVTALLESKLTAYRLAPVLDVEEVRVRARWRSPEKTIDRRNKVSSSVKINTIHNNK
jgi:glycylpeptide N-tetradecanoyltransferase